MNEYDSNRILDVMKKSGYTQTLELSNADCYILNTCHIREKASDKVYHDVGRVKKEFRNKKKPILLVIGCVAQAEGDVMLKREKYIDAIVGPQSYHKIVNIIKNLEKNKHEINETEFEVVEKFDYLNQVKNSNSKVTSFLTIQEGCDKFCKFCVVPYTRGPEYSRSFEEIIKEAEQLILNGSKEITLLGQNVNAYKHNNKRLSDLIYKLNLLDGLERIRYTTSHPKDVTRDLIEAHVNCNKLMPLLHLPVQSGSTKILKNMNRNHSLEEYLEIIKKFKVKKPIMKFSSDFIIAYPGEDERDFNETINLMEEVKFINTYSFIYSPRPGTPASDLALVKNEVAKERLERFQVISNKIKANYRKDLLNKKSKVLFENKVKDENKYFGRDEYANSVIVHSNIDISGKVLNVKINKSNQNTLFGTIIHEAQKKNAAA